MMIRLLLFFLLLFVTTPPVSAQQTRAPYTSNNSIFITFEGQEGNYDYASGKLLVRYNENTRRLECLLPVEQLQPANDSTPIVMAQEVFYTSRFPELYLEIEAPVEQLNAGNRNRVTLNSRVFLHVQGIIREMVVPVTFTPDRNMISFNTNFDVMLQDMRLRVPARYTPMLSGRILFTIHNARWADLRVR